MSVRTLVDGQRAKLSPLAAQLDALSPLAILGRGYSLVRNQDGKLVRDAAKLKPKETVSLTFGQGSATATINEVTKQ